MSKLIGPWCRVMKGLKKVDGIVKKAKKAVDTAKTKVDQLDEKSDKYYKAFGHVYNCKTQVCNHKNTVEDAVYGPMK